MTGMLTGLTLGDASADALAMRYLAAVQAVAYGTRAIVERMGEVGDG